MKWERYQIERRQKRADQFKIESKRKMEMNRWKEGEGMRKKGGRKKSRQEQTRQEKWVIKNVQEQTKVEMRADKSGNESRQEQTKVEMRADEKGVN